MYPCAPLPRRRRLALGYIRVAAEAHLELALASCRARPRPIAPQAVPRSVCEAIACGDGGEVVSGRSSPVGVGESVRGGAGRKRRREAAVAPGGCER